MQPVKRGDVPRLIGRTKGGLNSKLHAVCDGEGRPVRLLLTEGQKSDHKGAATLLADLPSATEMLGDKGYDSDAYRAALVKRGITPCIPPRAKRKNPATYSKALYKQRHKVKTCSLNSKTGGASQCAMTAAHMFFYLQSRSPL